MPLILIRLVILIILVIVLHDAHLPGPDHQMSHRRRMLRLLQLVVRNVFPLRKTVGRGNSRRIRGNKLIVLSAPRVIMHIQQRNHLLFVVALTTMVIMILFSRYFELNLSLTPNMLSVEHIQVVANQN